ncbi:Glucose-6-phosphate isomerase [Paraburkholderia nemoris]|uniref:hypothetical protein n=1 Tax=Paraburkholderia nemoris TaxID=2793076 RepID=UPI0019142D7A|nr:hypothetical protein [Paraburkholderia nemoris]CAE6958169.1 Glucose-6-phosphate isomerase [Paraburkholderia nemoris]
MIKLVRDSRDHETGGSLQPPTDRPAWKTPAEHHRKVRNQHPRLPFVGDPLRGERLSVEAASLYLEYSKHRVTDPTIALLVQLAGECSLAERIDAMFSGATINVTEPS